MPPEPGGLDAGSVVATLGTKIDDAGFAEFDRELNRVEKSKGTATLAAQVDRKGFLEAAKAIEQIESKEATVPIEFEVDKASLSKARTEVSALDKAFGQLGGSVGKTNRNFQFFRNTLNLIKWPALITAVGLAAQGISALAGGAAALTGALGPLSGLLTTYPTLLSTIGQVAGTVALSGIGNLTEALGGNEEAMKRLTPQGKQFLDTLKSFEPQYRRLQAATQRPLFAGLERGLEGAIKNFPVLRRVMHGTAEVLGDLAKRAGNFLGREGFGRDFERIGDINAKLLGRLGRGGLHLADALRHVLSAARPLTDWLGRMGLEIGKDIDQAATLGRKTGEMGEFFEKTRDITERLTSILGSMGEGLYEISKLGAPLGRFLLKELDASAASFEKWTQSAKGRNSIKDYFDAIKDPLVQAGKLLGAIVETFFRLGETPGLTKVLRQVRTEILPAFEELTAATTAAFGPVLIDFIVEVSKLLTNFVGAAGPLNIFVRVMTEVVGVVNDLLEASPFVRNAAVAFISLGAALKTLDFIKVVSGFNRIKKAGQAFAESKIGGKIVDGISSGLDAARGQLRRAATRMRTILTSVLLRAQIWTAAAAEAVGSYIGSMVGRIKARAGTVRAAIANLLKGRAITNAVSTAGGVLGGEAIAAMLGRWRKSGGSGGPFYRMGRFAGRWLARGIIAGVLLLLPELGNEIRKWIEDHAPSWFKNITEVGLPEPPGAPNIGIPEGVPIIGGGQHGGIVTRGGIIPRAGPRDTAGPFMLEPGEEVIPVGERRRRGVESPISEETVAETEKRAKKIRDTVEDRFEESSKESKKRTEGIRDTTRREWEQIERAVDRRSKQSADHVERRFGDMERKGGERTKRLGRDVDRQWDKMQDDVGDRSRKMEKDSTSSFEKIRKTGAEKSSKLAGSVGSSMRTTAGSVYEGMRYIADATERALKAFDAKPIKLDVPKPKLTSGGGEDDKKARGGMLRGHGRGDTVPLVLGMAAPGEAVLTRHQQRWVNRAMSIAQSLGAMPYGNLGHLFRGERRPHGMQQGGEIDGFQGGGMVRVPGDPDLTGGRDKVNQSVVDLAASLVKRFKLEIGYAFDPGGGHVSPGHNVTGTAIDIVPGPGGSWGLVGQAVQWSTNRGMTVYYDGSFGSTDLPPHGPGHHAHIELDEGIKGAAGGVAKLIGPMKVKGTAGGMRDLVQAIVDPTLRDAANKYIKQNAIPAHGSLAGIDQSGPIAEIARRMVTSRWNQGQWPPFMELKVRESGPTWDPTITNPSSGAGGIPQALPPSKMGSPAWPPTHGRESIIAQLAWMVDYIAGRYGTPSGALSFHDAHNYYQQGGIIGTVAPVLGGLGPLVYNPQLAGIQGSQHALARTTSAYHSTVAWLEGVLGLIAETEQALIDAQAEAATAAGEALQEDPSRYPTYDKGPRRPPGRGGGRRGRGYQTGGIITARPIGKDRPGNEPGPKTPAKAGRPRPGAFDRDFERERARPIGQRHLPDPTLGRAVGSLREKLDSLYDFRNALRRQINKLSRAMIPQQVSLAGQRIDYLDELERAAESGGGADYAVMRALANIPEGLGLGSFEEVLREHSTERLGVIGRNVRGVAAQQPILSQFDRGGVVAPAAMPAAAPAGSEAPIIKAPDVYLLLDGSVAAVATEVSHVQGKKAGNGIRTVSAPGEVAR